MRIITGKAKGTKLFSPSENEAVRPTTEMSKEGIFSAIQFDIDGKEFLDLFAGSGQMGLEAVSRGAKNATFVDASEHSVGIIRKNIEKTKLGDYCQLIRSEYGEYIKNCEKRNKQFDYIFADPPYDKDLAPELCKRIIRAGMVRPGGLLILETAANEFDIEKVPEEVRKKIERVKQYKFSKCFVYFVYVKDENNE